MSETPIEVTTGQMVYGFGAVVAGILLLVTFFLVVVIRYFRFNARKHVEMMRAMSFAQEMERSRIALDMHDGMGPLLSAVKLQVEALSVSPEPDRPALVAETKLALDQAIQQMREVVRELVPRNLEQKGLAGSLQDLIQYLEARTKISFAMDTGPLMQRFSMQAEMNLYRIVQEVIANSMKHGAPTHIQIRFQLDERRLHLVIQDDGKGFNPEQVSGGSGLQNIQSRTFMLQGSCIMQTQQGHGVVHAFHFERKNLE